MAEPHMKDFIALCKNHGFSRKGKVFSRCVGDAIYQNISLAQSAYIYPTSSEYSTMHKRAPYISIGFWSMYAQLPLSVFEKHGYLDQFTPENIVGEKFNYYMGFENQYEIMRDIGFDLLDHIQSQRELVDTFYTLYKAETGSYPIHNTELAAPFLLCGEHEEAFKLCAGIYFQNWDVFHNRYDHLKKEGRYEEYFSFEAEFEEDLRHTVTFMNYMLGKRTREIKENLLSNFQRNQKSAQDSGAVFAPNYQPLLPGRESGFF